MSTTLSDAVRSPHALAVLVIVMLLASTAPRLDAQTSFALAPRAGVIVPVDALGDAPSLLQIPGVPPESSRAELGAGALLGFSLMVDRAGLPVVLRTDIDIAPSLPVRLDRRRSAYDVSLAMVTAGVMTRPAMDGRLRPYAQAGLGFRSFRTGVSVSHGPQIPDHRLDPQARLGAGADLVAGKVVLRAELESQFASFRFDAIQDHRPERSLHMDVAMMVGLRFGIR